MERATGGVFFEHPRYELLHAIGAGGFGEVYEALDRSTGDKVALKRLVSTRGRNLSRFKQEFRALSGVHDPHLVELRELFEHDGTFCIVMELVPGVDLEKWLREALPANENEIKTRVELIRQTFRGIADGLCALHASGLVHRDLKPSNVRVTPEGRVVLLDFGLVSSLDDDLRSRSVAGAGTAEYMAPEQASGTRVSESIDWYAFGVCLYHALFGVLPFEGANQIHIMMQKQQLRPELPKRDLPAEISELAQLCLALLEPRPEERAGENEVRKVLSLTHHHGEDTASIPPSRALTGRSDELVALEEAFEKTLAGEFTITLVEGEGGVGKSALVNEFARQQRQHGALVLRGRCYENELAAYKAFDGCIEDLEHHLTHLPYAECRMVLPRHAALLAQLFPVLRGVKQIADASDEDAPAEPAARRLAAFQAVNELLSNLGRETPVVLIMDDLQWADAESFRLLRFLAESDQRPPILVLATLRPAREIEERTQQRLSDLRELPSVSAIELRGLSSSHARDLAKRLMGSEVPEPIVARITKESRGHPLFIAELVRYVGSRDLEGEHELSLPTAISGRLRALDADAREILDLVALSARPCPRATLRAACTHPQAADENIRLLLARQWLVLRAGDRLACQHETVRQTIDLALSTEPRRRLSKRLALALSNGKDYEPAELARLWEEAGERERARDEFGRAGDSALENLAFSRAENMYARALELCGEADREVTTDLLTKRAHALASAGMSAAAADLFATAAEQSSGAERTRLSVLAAQQLIQGGQPEEGVRAAKEILEQLGLHLPEGPTASIARLLWHRAMLRGSGLKTKTSSSQVDEHERLVLDALQALSAPLTVVDALRGTLINVLHLRRALVHGDPPHVARALSQEASFRAIERPDDPQVAALLERGRALAEETGDPRARAFQLFCEAGAATFAFRLADQRRTLDAAVRMLEEKCPGEPWLLTLTRMTLGSALYVGGNHKELSEESGRWLLQASERRDRFALAALSGVGFGAFRHIVADKPKEALREVEFHSSQWKAQSTSLLHFGPAYTTLLCRLYEGGDLAASWLAERGAEYEGGITMRAEFPRTWWSIYRCLATLSAAATGRSTDVSQVTREARALCRAKAGFVRAAGLFLTAQLDVLEGRRELARTSARQARAAFEAAGAGYFATAASYLLGLVESGSGDNDRCRGALSTLSQEGWVDPWKGVATITPVIRCVEAAPKKSDRKELVAGRYRVLDELGRGTFGTVTRAEDIQTGRVVALKTLDHVRPSALVRFKREFRARQDVHHPNLVRLEGLLEHAGTWHIAMELVLGSSFRRATRPRGTLDEPTLRKALRGLLEGLHALHRAGLVHRDLTSDNILVTPEGRAVVLDFGLVAETGGSTTDEGFVGTPHYAAPEQAELAAPDTRADMYAVGVCLFEALTGTLPFPTMKPLLALQQKRDHDAPRPSSITPMLPSDLEGLCVALLSRDPRMRPSAEAALTLLTQSPAPERRSLSAPGVSLRPAGYQDAFVGREAELERLFAAERAARSEGLSLVLIQGESGLGKTALAGEFLRRLEQRDGALVLRSRCYENAQVSYEAFDAGMDTLATMLREKPERERMELLPRRRGQLGLLFPTLHALLPEVHLDATPQEGPTGRKLHAVSALIELLSNVARTRPLVLAVDDLQWADQESFALFDAMLRDRASLPCLIVATLRDDREISADSRSRLASLEATGATTRLALKGLPEAEAQRLLRSWVDDADIETAALVSLGHEHGAGHPLLLREMARKLLQGDAASLRDLTLDDALLSRVRELDSEARELLELVSVAGRPYPPQTYLAALNHPADFEGRLSRLLSERLLRIRRGHDLACDHDRTRRLVCDSLAAPRFAEHARRLAEVLDGAAYADAADRARLWDAAGEAERASTCYEEAAHQALENLAFSRAETFFSQALARISDPPRSRLYKLRMGRGLALVHAGRSAEAAQEFELAASQAEGAEATRARVLCAQNLLQSAQIEAGLDKTFTLFRELGAPIPEGNASAISSLIWARTRLSMRGLDLTTKATETTANDMVLDAMYELSAPLAWVALLPGFALNNAYLLRALSHGEPKHAARALAMEAVAVGIQNPADSAPSEKLLTRADALSREIDEPSTRAFVQGARGSVSLMHFDFAGAVHNFQATIDLMAAQKVDDPWMLTSVRMNLGSSLYSLGRHVDSRTLSEEWLEEARARGDRFAVAALTGLGFGFVRHLANDDPETARAELEEALKGIPAEPLGYAHIGEFMANAMTSGYRGSSHAYHWFEAQQKRHGRAFLLQTEFSRTWLETYRATACFAALADTEKPNHGPILSSAERSGKKLAKLKPTLSRHLGDFVLGQVSAARGNREDALTRLRRAREGFHQANACTFELCAHYLEGLLVGGDTGRAAVDHAISVRREQAYRDPKRALEMHVPVARLLS